ncbi:MAG: nucleotidyltransferase family protein, partial [Bdellovibrionales bacterium]
MNFFGLTSEQFEIVNSLVIKPLKNRNCRVWIFGSRSTGKFQKFSDLDILYESTDEIELSFIFNIKSNIEESNLPIKVDIVNIKDLAESYSEEILKNRILV